jgi:hypothetical protein
VTSVAVVVVTSVVVDQTPVTRHPVHHPGNGFVAVLVVAEAAAAVAAAAVVSDK